uniref:Trimeric autotransporter adhesin YadA-like C-terminal membrane anchor domain-containing protein n=1 Tax=Amphimedon queenslandica TaxID=400682 RepID=A0A1X7UWY1_AMPQE
MTDAANAIDKAMFNPSGIGFAGTFPNGPGSNWGAAGGVRVAGADTWGVGVGAGVVGQGHDIIGPQFSIGVGFKF